MQLRVFTNWEVILEYGGLCGCVGSFILCEMRKRDAQKEQWMWSHVTRGCVPLRHLPFPDFFMKNTEAYLNYFFLAVWEMSSLPLKLFQNVNVFTIFHSVDMPEFQPLSSWGTLFPHFIVINYCLKNVFCRHFSPQFWSLFRIESLKRSYQGREYDCFQGSGNVFPNHLPERSCNLYSPLTSSLQHLALSIFLLFLLIW